MGVGLERNSWFGGGGGGVRAGRFDRVNATYPPPVSTNDGRAIFEPLFFLKGKITLTLPMFPLYLPG